MNTEIKQAKLSGCQFREIHKRHIKRTRYNEKKEEIHGHPRPTLSQYARAMGPRVLSPLFIFGLISKNLSVEHMSGYITQ